MKYKELCDFEILKHFIMFGQFSGSKSRYFAKKNILNFGAIAFSIITVYHMMPKKICYTLNHRFVGPGRTGLAGFLVIAGRTRRQWSRNFVIYYETGQFAAAGPPVPGGLSGRPGRRVRAEASFPGPAHRDRFSDGAVTVFQTVQWCSGHRLQQRSYRI
jgi:hypothetical protein